MSDEFDVEEYATDLARRHSSLMEQANLYHQAWRADGSPQFSAAYQDFLRCSHKAQGIQIALDLLPKPPPPVESYCLEDRDGDLWAFIEGYGWDPVRIDGGYYPSVGRGTAFPTFESGLTLLSREDAE